MIFLCVKKLPNILMLIAMLFVSGGCVQNQLKLTHKHENEIKSEVNEAFMRLVEAAKSLNVGRYLQFFDAKKFSSLNADGSVFHSLEAFEKSYREQVQYIEKYESLEFKKIKISVINSDVAVLVNQYNATVMLKTSEVISALGAGTQIWSKKSGQWKLVHVSSSAKN